MRKSTMRDVAHQAGVSIGTVSKYFNTPALVTEKTAVRIRVAVKELNYTPNALAKKLASGKSNNILLYILVETEIADSTWLHQLPLIRAFNRVLDETGYGLQVKIGSVLRPQPSRDCLRQCIAEHSIDGVALFSAWEVDPCLLEILSETNFPFVLIDNHTSEIDTNQIYFNNAAMVCTMMERLYRLGHREIGFLSVDSLQQHILDRMLGYRLFAKQFQLDAERFVKVGAYTVECGYACMTALIDEGRVPTAMICGNDNMAAGAVHAALDRGYRVPEDLSIMGIDGSIIASATRPTLATVLPPMDQMGTQAIESLIALIEQRIDVIPSTVYGCTLVDGGSIGPPRQRR